MKFNRLLTAAVFATAMLTAVPGCQLFAPAPTVPLTPAEQQVRNETTVRVSASMGTRIALLAIKDDAEATATAKLVNTIAGDVLAVTVNDTLSLAGIHDVVVKHIAEINATPKQKLIALQIVDSVALLIQANSSTDTSANPDDNIRLVRSAAQGAKDATLIFLP